LKFIFAPIGAVSSPGWLADWIPLLTDTAANNPVVFVDIYTVNNPDFYRMGRLPKPLIGAIKFGCGRVFDLRLAFHGNNCCAEASHP
jgi:hypothetical protein